MDFGKPSPAQDGDDGEVGDETGDADDELQDDLQPEVDHGVRLLHVLKKNKKDHFVSEAKFR